MTTPDTIDRVELEKLQDVRRTLLLKLALSEPLGFSGVTRWEELTCVGYNPGTSTLEAVVRIKLTNGYSGGLCGPGSKEYVRFFVDYGSGFEDLGYTSFDAHDIPDSPAVVHPLDYVVPMPLPDTGHRRCCNSPVNPVVRAVLSWNTPPSADPNILNAYGNKLDVNIQLLPKPLSLQCLIAIGAIKKGSPILEQLDLDVPLPKSPLPLPLNLVQQMQAYKGTKVPAHRLLSPVLMPLIAAHPGAGPISTAAIQEISQQGVDVAGVVQSIQATSADVTYEELTCAGLQTAFDTVGAVLHVKLPYGYSGDLCQSGSKEYVAFWADWNNDGAYEDYLGTADVDVHDLGGSLPAGGVRYSVSLLVPRIVQHLRSCGQPNIVHLRAVLSWATPPSQSDPNALNTWGNRLDVLVQIRPGTAVAPTQLTDLIYRVGGVALSDVSASTHLAYPSTVLTGGCSSPAMDRPWGGVLTIQGRIYNTGAPGSVRFRIRFKRHADPDVDASWTPITFSQDFVLMRPLVIPPQQAVHQVAGTEPGLGGGWFGYVEDPTASPPILERDNRLGDWATGSLEGDYDLRLEYRRATDPAGLYQTSSLASVRLHNYSMVASVVAAAVIDSSKDVDLVIDGGDCHSYQQSALIKGHLRVIDPYFWKWAFDLQPSTHTNGTVASPSCRAYLSLADAGDANLAWTLDTKPLDKCGYTLTVRGYDRTIVNNGGSSVHTAAKAVGFAVN